MPDIEKEKLAKMMEGRKTRCTEVLTSEKTYVEFLSIMTRYFTTPLKRNSMGLTPREIHGIFSNADTLELCHKELYAKIEKRFEKSV